MKACQNCGGTEWVRCEDGTACGNCGLLPYVEPSAEEIRAQIEQVAEDAARCDGQIWANLPESAKQHYRDIAAGEGPGAYGGPADERIATDAERAKLHGAGFRETKLKTLWIAPPSYGGRILSVDESLSELARVEGISA